MNFSKKLTGAAIMASVFAIAGCDGDPTHDVTWYKAHAQERAAKLAQCHNDPGELEHAPNCRNADQAAAELSLDPNKKDMPHLDPNKIGKLGG